MKLWYAVNTLPNQENRAERNLLKQNFRVWLPSFKRTRRHARRVDVVNAPLFPGYLFVELNLEADGWGKINHTFGVKALLAAGGLPKAVPTSFIEALREKAKGTGYIEDAQTVTALPAIGDTVRVTEGPFESYMATVTELVAKDRVKVLLEILGGRFSASLSSSVVTNIA